MSLNKNNKHYIGKKLKISKDDKIKNPSKTNIQKNTGPWTEDEDRLLKEWIDLHGDHDWANCSKYIQTRTGKQCREHWKNTFNSQIKKGKWTAEEDLLILKLYQKYKSWKKINPIFEKRSENSIKNRFYIQLRKIAVKKEIYGKTEDVAKLGLDKLKDFLDEAIEEAENNYFEQNKKMTKEKFIIFIHFIEEQLDGIRKNKFIDLKGLKSKVFNETNDDINKNNNNNDNNNSDTMSYEEEESDKKTEKKIINENKDKNNYISKLNKDEEKQEQNNINSIKSGKNLNTMKVNFLSKNNLFDSFLNNNIINKADKIQIIIKGDKANINNDLIIRRNSKIEQTNDNAFVAPLKQKSSKFLRNKSSYIKNQESDVSAHLGDINKEKNTQLLYNTSFNIENYKKGNLINPCPSFNTNSKSIFK